jgi:hypothetical protein
MAIADAPLRSGLAVVRSGTELRTDVLLLSIRLIEQAFDVKTAAEFVQPCPENAAGS